MVSLSNAAEIVSIVEAIVDTKDTIVVRLRENGCRITKQRLKLIDIILENECSSCKEIYYKAAEADEKIGIATVYRMVSALEEIGAINRRNMYKVNCSRDCRCAEDCSEKEACTIVLDDDTTYRLTEGKWNKVVSEGLKRCGYLKDHKVASIKIEE